MRLGAIIAANVDIRWARALLGDKCYDVSDDDWIKKGMPSKPRDIEEDDRNNFLEDDRDEFCESEDDHYGRDHEVGNRNHAKLYGKVTERVEKLPYILEPGWTRCFYFEAWVRPTAEHEFLRQCCRWTNYSSKARKRHLRRMAKIRVKPIPRFSGSAATTHTGLPRVHPVEAVQMRMRPFFEKLQHPDAIAARFQDLYRRHLDTYVAQAAKLLPAVTPITLDPYLNEQLIYPVEYKLMHFAVEGAWETCRL